MFWRFKKRLYLCTRNRETMAGERMIHNHEVPGSIPGPATKRKLAFRRLPLLGAFLLPHTLL